MPAGPSHADIAIGVPQAGASSHSDLNRLRVLVIAAGLMASVLFIVIGLRYALQLYGDGAMFSYSVAAQDAWAFHWHNISGRLTVYLLTLLPAEAYVGLTGDPNGGIVVYGFLFFAAPLLGLIATFAADRSKGRIIFGYACFSTACLCPLVFGFPTEMWLAQALFWPALAVAHYARRTIAGTALVFATLLLLTFTHEGALVLAFAIVATVALRGMRDRLFLRTAGALLVALAAWGTVKVLLPPDDYFAAVYVRAALDFFDLRIFTSEVVLLLFATIAGYSLALLILVRITPAKAHVYAAAIVGLALAAYWLRLDHALHATDRYYLRTLLVIATPGLGLLAALYALRADARLKMPISIVTRVMGALTGGLSARAIAGAFALVMLVHAVETEKFVTAWTKYKAAVTALATGTASDRSLGDARFVSSARIDADLNRLSWFSTTPYLSVILAKFAPTRLVVDPRAANYFWLSCETATANLSADRAVPVESRRLVRVHACLHRK